MQHEVLFLHLHLISFWSVHWSTWLNNRVMQRTDSRDYLPEDQRTGLAVLGADRINLLLPLIGQHQRISARRSMTPISTIRSPRLTDQFSDPIEVSND